MPRRPQPLRERLFPRLVIDTESGCLLWTGCLDEEGYGRITLNGKRYRVHRAMYEMFEGPIPGDLPLDHLCRVRHCANVAHLEAVTDRVNILRGVSPAAVHATATHCVSGHPFDLVNTYLDPHGWRRCRICTRDYQRRYEARKRAAPAH